MKFKTISIYILSLPKILKWVKPELQKGITMAVPQVLVMEPKSIFVAFYLLASQCSNEQLCSSSSC